MIIKRLPTNQFKYHIMAGDTVLGRDTRDATSYALTSQKCLRGETICYQIDRRQMRVMLVAPK